MNNKDEIPQDLKDGLIAFSKEADALISAFSAPLIAEDPPSIVYHYTDYAGVIGILQTGTFWFTNVFKLNDPSEILHGFSYLTDALNQQSDKGDIEKLFASEIGNFVNGDGLKDSSTILSCSFSSNGDDLGQWRAYGDNGRGYALGFKTKQLEEAFQAASRDKIFHATFPITYEKKELVAIQQKLVNVATPLLNVLKHRGLGQGILQEYIRQLYAILTFYGLTASLFFKHSAYSNESEYRFLQIMHKGASIENLKFRVRPHSLMEYVEFDWKSVAADTLSEIVVGPSLDYAVASQFVRDCTTRFCGGPIAAVSSRIPYRTT